MDFLPAFLEFDLMTISLNCRTTQRSPSQLIPEKAVGRKRAKPDVQHDVYLPFIFTLKELPDIAPLFRPIDA
jgi:hypothetical protein